MSDQQQPDQPPAGAPGAWPPPQPQQPGWQPQQQPGWQPQQQPDWNQAPQQPGWQAPQQPGWQAPPQPGWQAPPQPGYPAPYAPPVQGGYPPPPPYSQPGGYAPAGYAMPRYAGFWIRLVAYIIDGLILGAIIFVLAITIIGLLLVIPVGLGYFPYLWWKRGASFGQSALGLRVVRAIDGGPIDGGMSCIRALVFYAEGFFAGWIIGLIGFCWAAFEPRKRAWHDMAAGTVVIHIN